MPRHCFNLPLSSWYSKCARILNTAPTSRLQNRNPDHVASNELFGRGLCRLCRTALSGSLSRFANPPDHGLDQTVDSFFFVSVHHLEVKLRFAFGPFVNSNRQTTAQIIFD